MEKQKVLEAIKKLKEVKRKFVQGMDLVINLKGVDLKKESIDFYVVLPHNIKEKKICLFAEKNVPGAEKIFAKIILKNEFANYDKKAAKKLAKEYDFFVSQAILMASVALAFGKAFGPVNKMPSPSTGSIVTKLDEKTLRDLVEKLSKTVRLKTKKDLSLKLLVGNQSMPEQDILENIEAVEESLAKNLHKGKENVKNILIKTTMGKPIKLE